MSWITDTFQNISASILRHSSWLKGCIQLLHFPHWGRVWNPRASSEFGANHEFGATLKQLIVPGNLRACLCVGEGDRVTWLDYRPALIAHNIFRLTKLNQHAFHINDSVYLVGLWRSESRIDHWIIWNLTPINQLGFSKIILLQTALPPSP